MLINLDIMPFFELIRFIVNRKSAALRLIFDRPRMLIRLFGFLVIFDLKEVTL